MMTVVLLTLYQFVFFQIDHNKDLQTGPSLIHF